MFNNDRPLLLSCFEPSTLKRQNVIFSLFSLVSAQRTRIMIQWASPEMLLGKTFSKKSDVWSFGILLYEIVTFGELPFSGKSMAREYKHF